MMMPLKERKRRAVRMELSEIAQELFMQHGFEATTVDQIVAAAGMSRRSFFRYFASKEDLAAGRYELLGDMIADALNARSPDEPVWDSLRHSFGVLLEYYREPHRRERDATTRQIIETSPTLFAAYLVRIDQMKDRLVAVLQKRAAHRNGHLAVDDHLLRAMVGSAVECLIAAFHAIGPEYDVEIVGRRLDELMDALRPAVADREMRPSSPSAGLPETSTTPAER